METIITAEKYELDQLQLDLIDVFAEITRYPKEILDKEANLEEDLGIDSVKLGEIFSVLREKYNLPENIGLKPEQLKSIETITNALSQYLNNRDNSELGNIQEENSISSSQINQGQEIGSHQQDKMSIQDNSLLAIEQVQNEVITVFAEITRYPEEILTLDASLEEELGIDSVKLGEIFSVFRERFGLPEKMDIPPEKLKNIAGITDGLFQYIQKSESFSENKIPPMSSSDVLPQTEKSETINVVEEPNFNASAGIGNSESIKNKIIEIFAEVTRYPVEILDEEANLEEDLGIDSVKLGEIFSVLREQYQLPEKMDIPQENLKNIRGIAAALSQYLADKISENGVDATTPEITSKKNGQDKPTYGTDTNSQPSKASFAALDPVLKPFEGKVAFISGSGRGLGKEIASYLASLGATIIVNSFHSRSNGLETAKEITANGGKAYHIWGSMANPNQLNDIFDEIEERYGAIDFFISNASNGMLAALEDITVEHWEKAFRTNIVGLHQASLRALNLMKKNGGGKIITLSSPASNGYVDYFGCMGAVKAAVESLTRSMAIEFSKYNVSVNCVSPGPIYGDLLNKWPESKRLIKKWEDNTAYERLCEAHDVSHFIAYLLSEPVKIFTGSILVMDGGISSQGW